jgi:hypothetical protein
MQRPRLRRTRYATTPSSGQATPSTNRPARRSPRPRPHHDHDHDHDHDQTTTNLMPQLTDCRLRSGQVHASQDTVTATTTMAIMGPRSSLSSDPRCRRRPLPHPLGPHFVHLSLRRLERDPGLSADPRHHAGSAVRGDTGRSVVQIRAHLLSLPQRRFRTPWKDHFHGRARRPPEGSLDQEWCLAHATSSSQQPRLRSRRAHD